MKKEQKLVFGFVIITMTIITMAGCDLFPFTQFPSEFRGTWRRETPGGLISTRTFTSNTYKISTQSNQWILTSISGNRYFFEQSNYRSHTMYEDIRYENGKLIISGCFGTGEDNCNGIWIKN